MKKKGIFTTISIIVIVLASVLIGLLVQLVWTSVEKNNYPRPETPYVTEDGSTMTIREMVTKYSGEYGVPEYIIYSVIKVESNFNEIAVSSAGAVGLMQLTPSTFEWLLTKTKETLSAETIYSPNVNIRYGTYYLRYLFVMFGDWDLVLAAYNAGQGSVSRWLEDPDYVDENGNLKYIPYVETREYVQKVNKAIEKYKSLYYS